MRTMSPGDCHTSLDHHNIMHITTFTLAYSTTTNARSDTLNTSYTLPQHVSAADARRQTRSENIHFNQRAHNNILRAS